MSQIKVGMTLYLCPTGNNKTKEIQTGVVSKVGKKYFYIEGYSRSKFLIDEMRDDFSYGYGSSWKCFFTMQEILDEKELAGLSRYLRGLFNTRHNLSLDQLRRMKVISEEAEKRYFKEQISPEKKGRTSNYAGGSVWKTYEGANKYCPFGYSVYGVDADWNRDTTPSKNVDWHDLLVDSKLINLSNKTLSEVKQ